jgi:DNA-binding FadR family transcriptional regulator
MYIAQKTRNVFIINTINYLIQAMTQPLCSVMKQGLLDRNISNARIKEHEDIYKAMFSRDDAAIMQTFQTFLDNCKKTILC